MLRVKVEEIKLKPVELIVEEPASGFPALAEVDGSGECEFIAPVRVHVTALREYDHIRVEGNVASKVRMHCSRCLEPFERDISSSFTLFYSDKTGIPLDDEAELTAEDLVSVHYEGDSIDFAGEIEEQLIMDIPYKPLCREDCLGLCSNCGANLNDGECGCGREAPNLKFGVLKNFKVNK